MSVIFQTSIAGRTHSLQIFRKFGAHLQSKFDIALNCIANFIVRYMLVILYYHQTMMYNSPHLAFRGSVTTYLPRFLLESPRRAEKF